MTPREIRKIPITWTANKSQPILVSDFRDIDITIIGTGNATVLGSAEKTTEPVDFTSPSVLGNSYAAIVIADLTTPSTYVTALAVAGATKLGEVNTNLLTWICIERSVDTLDAFITICDNQ